MDQHKAPDKTQMWKENVLEVEAQTGDPGGMQRCYLSTQGQG